MKNNLDLTLDPIIRAVQTIVGVKADADPREVTWKAIYRALAGKDYTVNEPLGTAGSVDERSERNISTLLPEVQPLARKLIHLAKAEGITIKVTSGLRTYSEQDALFNQPRDGKDNDGDGRVDESDEKVTNARGGYSNHNFGLAFDVTIFVGSTPIWESPGYQIVGRLGKSLGLRWGGDWVSIKDEPHFEFNPHNYTLVQLRERKAAGLPLI